MCIFAADRCCIFALVQNEYEKANRRPTDRHGHPNAFFESGPLSTKIGDIEAHFYSKRIIFAEIW